MAAEDTIRKWLELMNRRDANAAAQLFASDCVIVDPGLPEPLRGREAWRQNAEQVWWRAFPDLQFEMKHILSRGNTVAAELVLRGTHAGPLPGPGGEIPATNRRFEVPGVGVWDV